MIDREYPIKAAYLYNFGTYIEWPESAFADPQAPFVLGVYGADPFGRALDQLSRRTLGQRPIVIRRLQSLDQVDQCHLLFVAGTISGEQQRRVLEATRGLPVLCVGESPGFAARGGEINFIQQENKIRFEINVQAVRERELRVSSKLLSLATIVESAPNNSPVHLRRSP